MGTVLSLLGLAGGFLKRIPWQAWAGIAAVAIIGLGIHLHGNAVKDAYDAAYAQGSKDTVQAFQRAQVKADADQRAKNATKAKQQAKIDQEKSNALAQTNADIDARANAISVRHEAATRRSQGSSGALPATGSPASQSCPAAAQDGLPWSIAFPLMIQAQKNEAQLNAVLDWEAAQDKLEPSP